MNLFLQSDNRLYEYEKKLVYDTLQLFTTEDEQRQFIQCIMSLLENSEKQKHYTISTLNHKSVWLHLTLLQDKIKYTTNIRNLYGQYNWTIQKLIHVLQTKNYRSIYNNVYHNIMIGTIMDSVTNVIEQIDNEKKRNIITTCETLLQKLTYVEYIHEPLPYKTYHDILQIDTSTIKKDVCNYSFALQYEEQYKRVKQLYYSIDTFLFEIYTNPLFHNEIGLLERHIHIFHLLKKTYVRKTMTTKELYHHSMCSLVSMTDDIPSDFFFGISFINKNKFFTYDDPNKEKMDTKFLSCTLHKLHQCAKRTEQLRYHKHVPSVQMTDNWSDTYMNTDPMSWWGFASYDFIIFISDTDECQNTIKNIQTHINTLSLYKNQEILDEIKHMLQLNNYLGKKKKKTTFQSKRKCKKSNIYKK